MLGQRFGACVLLGEKTRRFLLWFLVPVSFQDMQRQNSSYSHKFNSLRAQIFILVSQSFSSYLSNPVHSFNYGVSQGLMLLCHWKRDSLFGFPCWGTPISLTLREYPLISFVSEVEWRIPKADWSAPSIMNDMKLNKSNAANSLYSTYPRGSRAMYILCVFPIQQAFVGIAFCYSSFKAPSKLLTSSTYRKACSFPNIYSWTLFTPNFRDIGKWRTGLRIDCSKLISKHKINFIFWTNWSVLLTSIRHHVCSAISSSL